MSSRTSILGRDSMMKEDTDEEVKRKRCSSKKLEDFSLGDLVEKFLCKDSVDFDRQRDKPPVPKA
jgi:hypothetical protein